jgi:peptide/nickel transport system permease protein
MAATEGISSDDSESKEVEAKFGLRHTLKQIKRDPTARFGMYVLGVVIAVTLFATIDTNLSALTFGRYDNFTLAEVLPILENPEQIPDPPYSTWDPPAWQAEGSWEHPLGTDHQGRDYVSRLVYGTRVSMMVAIFATAFGAVGGTLIGAIAGYYGGWVDEALMRFIEMIYAIPPLILVIVFTVFVSQNNPDIQYALIGVGIAASPVFARIIRSRVLSIREMEYIEAAKAAGVKDRNIIMRHVIPNSFAPVVVYASLYAGISILIVAGLSFLGYGAQPPTPDWGQMISRAHRTQMHINPIASVWPGIAIIITVMGFNLLGDGLQDALDPRIEN